MSCVCRTIIVQETVPEMQNLLHITQNRFIHAAALAPMAMVSYNESKQKPEEKDALPWQHAAIHIGICPSWMAYGTGTGWKA
jgi:hypothetical protein